MDLNRREIFQAAAATSAAVSLLAAEPAEAGLLHKNPGWVEGRLTGAAAVVETLLQEGCECVYGIPGAQENELWDSMKTRGLPYLLCTHEFSAACMADGYARSLGKPGVLCVVPGPGVTNSLTGLGEALVDSVPLVAIVGDIAKGEKYRPFQVHCLDQAALLRPVTKGVFEVTDASQIPSTIRQAFALAMSGEPGPVAVVIPYTQLIDVRHYKDAPLTSRVIPFDEFACNCAIRMLSDKRLKVGIYAGQGCQDFSEQLTAVAEMLQAPVATSVSGKGVIHEGHPLSVGWGYGPQGTETAEKVFAGKLLPHHHGVDVLLAIGVRFSEVSTGFYSNPQTKHVIHVDSSKANIGQVLRTDVPVHADAGAFLAKLLEHAALLRRPADTHLLAHIRDGKAIENKHFQRVEGKHGADPQAFINALRKVMPEDGLLFVDVTVSEHLAAESYRVCRPRSLKSSCPRPCHRCPQFLRCPSDKSA